MIFFGFFFVTTKIQYAVTKDRRKFSNVGYDLVKGTRLVNFGA